MQEALQMIRQDLGPDAAVLQTRQTGSSLMRWLTGARQIEVTASLHADVPARFPEPPAQAGNHRSAAPATADNPADNPAENSPQTASLQQPPAAASWQEQLTAPGVQDTSQPQQHDGSALFQQNFDKPAGATSPQDSAQQPPAASDRYGLSSTDVLMQRVESLQSVVEELRGRETGRGKTSRHELPAAMFQLFTGLIDAEMSEDLARELLEEIRQRTPAELQNNAAHLRAELLKLVASEIPVCGPVRVTPGHRRLIALVGPTGVGKTTTIAKLAANFRLRHQHRVGLITVDTYRIAAVEQLRTYADIIDLPMEVVATPGEMQSAVQRMRHLDLILLDTAGRSPRDEAKLQEVREILSAAGPDETHLVLSSSSSETSLKKTAERFSRTGVNALIYTKLDEATGLGSLLPLLRSSGLPLSYVTNGQNVPGDIAPADAGELAEAVLSNNN